MISNRDRDILGFMANWPFMFSEQVQQYAGMSPRVTWRRLARLCELGLVDFSQALGARRKFYYVSREGLQFLGFSAENSNPKGVKLHQAEHDKKLVDIALSFYAEHPDYTILGESKIRRIDSAAIAAQEETEYSIRRFTGGRSVHVFPDMVAEKGNARFYIEYEHTPKDKKRLNSLMMGYVNSPKVTAVKYYVAPAAWGHVSDVYNAIKNDLPLVGGKPKVQIELYEGGE